MKYLLPILLCSQLLACAVISSDSDCDFGHVPTPYLQDNSGHYIDLNGIRVAEKVPNPYYQQYLRCQQRANATTTTSHRTVAIPVEQHRVLGQVFSLSEPKEILTQEHGQYVSSVFTNPDNSALLQHEVFVYPRQDDFKQRFFADINQTEGKFTKASVKNLPYFIGTNNHGDKVIYVVKQLPQQRISIVQLRSKQPFQPQDLATWVQDLYKLSIH